MKNIVMCIPSLGFGGAERVTIRLAEEFSKEFKVTIVTTYTSDKEYIHSNKIERISLKSEFFLQKARKFRSLVKELNPEFIITMFAPMYIFVYFSLLGIDIPQIVSERNDPESFSGKKLVKLLYQYTMSKADGCVFQTEQVRKYYENKFSIKSIVIHNPIVEADLPKTTKKRSNEIVNVGRLHPQKNQKLLIDSMIEIHEQISEYKLIIYGDGPLKNELQEYIDENQANSYIKLYGKTDKVLSLINNASLFILSSDFEGMPNALVEAMCLGIPSISTDCPCGGPKELIVNNVNGILVETNNRSQLSNAILKVLTNSQLSSEISENSKKLIHSLNIKTIATKWLDFCYEIKEMNQ